MPIPRTVRAAGERLLGQKQRLAGSVVAALLLILLCAPGAHARGLKLGFMDSAAFEGPENATWYGRVRSIDGDLVRLTAHWSQIAPRVRTALVDPTSPTDPGYSWERLDATLRGAADHGLDVLLTVQSAPAWAEGAGRPSDARPGAWRPEPGPFADFMEAIALRYGGSVPDPARPGAALPRIRNWQIWNEPNLDLYLAPQWTGDGPEAKATTPAIYRRLLNAGYARVKAVHADNLVIAAGTAPYGDPPEADNRMTPVRFMRELLCLRGWQLERTRCPQRARLDGIDHHPYATGSPTARALLPENVAVPDLRKLTSIVDRARRAKTVRPVGPKSLWVTEVSWDSSPPDPRGVPEAKHARWLQDSFYSLWRQGASRICWYLLRDSAPKPSYETTYQSGLFTLDGEAKYSARAFRFPLSLRRSGRRTTAWGRAPVDGRVTIERRSGGGWSPIATVGTGADGIFELRIRVAAGAQLRARVGDESSLTRRAR